MTTGWIKEYKIPSKKGEGWGRFILTQDGMFSCVSEYGNYAFWWGAIGERDFREFVANLAGNEYYVCQKLCHHPYPYDPQDTLKAVKTYILDTRRRRKMSAEDARKEWDLLDYHEDLWGIGNLIRWYDDTKLPEAYEFAVYNPPANALALVNRLLPRLAKVLRDEMEAEKEGKDARD